MRLENTSLIAQQYSLPSVVVRCSVISVSQTRFGALARNTRCT